MTIWHMHVAIFLSFFFLNFFTTKKNPGPYVYFCVYEWELFMNDDDGKKCYLNECVCIYDNYDLIVLSFFSACFFLLAWFPKKLSHMEIIHINYIFSQKIKTNINCEKIWRVIIINPYYYLCETKMAIFFLLFIRFFLFCYFYNSSSASLCK